MPVVSPVNTPVETSDVPTVDNQTPFAPESVSEEDEVDGHPEESVEGSSEGSEVVEDVEGNSAPPKLHPELRAILEAQLLTHAKNGWIRGFIGDRDAFIKNGVNISHVEAKCKTSKKTTSYNLKCKCGGRACSPEDKNPEEARRLAWNALQGKCNRTTCPRFDIRPFISATPLFVDTTGKTTSEASN